MAVTDYLGGDGSQNSKYIIHNASALREFLSVGILNGKYGTIVADIDMSGIDVGSATNEWSGHLYGNGYKIKNLSKPIPQYYVVKLSGSINNVWFLSFSVGSTGGGFGDLSYGSFNDCLFQQCNMYFYNARNSFNRCLALGCATFVSAGGSQSISVTNSYAVVDVGGSASAAPAGFSKLTSGNIYLSSNYVGFGSAWVMDSASPPRLAKIDVTDLTRAYCVVGTTRVGGLPKQRRVSAHSPVDYYMAASKKSDANGKYIINVGYYTDHVLIIHSDEYGVKFTKSKAYVIGDVIHPSAPNGYRYICTTAGTSAATYPTAWPTSGTLTTGSAIFTPAPVYKPETMLVVPVLIDLVTGLPV